MNTSRESRRAFVKKSALLAALSAVGVKVPGAAAAASPEQRDADAQWMALSIAHWQPQQARMQLAKMMGATGAVSGAGRDPAARKRQFEAAGLQWTVCEGVRLDRAQLGVAGRDEDIEAFVELIRQCAAVGQDVICYNWMPVISWARTDMARVDRGGSLVTAFDGEAIPDTSLTEYGAVSKEALWKNMAYFLQAVVPVAEKHGVRLALHPDDPPVDHIRGIARIITSFEALKRVAELYPSPHNGFCFCQGSIASQRDTNIPEAIRYFGERGLIHFVHFRDVRGHTTNFTEAWHDDGKTDMYEAMQAYYDVGFRGPIRPDHVPTITGYEDNTHPGYNDLGTLFAIGYIKGLMEAVAKSSA
jgi:mannonate dehydratase